MIGIIAAMEKELELLRKTMGSFELQEIAGFKFYIGKIKEKDVTILHCGIGKVNAAVGCAVLIQQFKPIFVINTGSAGGIHPELKVGDAIISSGLVYHDVDVTAFGYAPGQIPHQPQIFREDKKLAKLAEDAVLKLKTKGELPGDFNCRRGLIGSGDVFMHDPQKIQTMKQILPDITAVEMEGAAIAHCCTVFSVPFLVIRAVSDVAGTESPVSFKEFLEIASEHSSKIVIKIIMENH